MAVEHGNDATLAPSCAREAFADVTFAVEELFD